MFQKQYSCFLNIHQPGISLFQIYLGRSESDKYVTISGTGDILSTTYHIIRSPLCGRPVVIIVFFRPRPEHIFSPLAQSGSPTECIWVKGVQ